MSETRLSPAALLLIGAILLPIVIESRVVIDWIFGVAVPFWWTVAVGVVVYGAILFWGTLPAPEDGPNDDTPNDDTPNDDTPNGDTANGGVSSGDDARGADP